MNEETSKEGVEQLLNSHLTGKTITSIKLVESDDTPNTFIIKCDDLVLMLAATEDGNMMLALAKETETELMGKTLADIHEPVFQSQ